MFYLTLCNCIPEGITGSHSDLYPVLNVSFEETQLAVWFNLLPSYVSSKLKRSSGSKGKSKKTKMDLEAARNETDVFLAPHLSGRDFRKPSLFLTVICVLPCCP